MMMAKKGPPCDWGGGGGNIEESHSFPSFRYDFVTSVHLPSDM